MSFDNSINTLCLLFCVSCLGNLIRKLSSSLFTYQSYLFIFFNQHYRKIVKFRWKQDSSLVSYWLRRSSAQNVQASSWTIIFSHKNGTTWKDSLRILQFTAKAFDCSGTWFPCKICFHTKFAYIFHLWIECFGPCIYTVIWYDIPTGLNSLGYGAVNIQVKVTIDLSHTQRSLI